MLASPLFRGASRKRRPLERGSAGPRRPPSGARALRGAFVSERSTETHASDAHATRGRNFTRNAARTQCICDIATSFRWCDRTLPFRSVAVKTVLYSAFVLLRSGVQRLSELPVSRFHRRDGRVCGLRWASADARYNVTGARRRASLLKVFAMWYTWTALLLVSCALVEAGEVEAGEVAQTESGTVTEAATDAPAPVATTRPPPRTLDRQAAELAWRSWLQSPESGNPNAPPRRITTKSLFITPLVCPKGQRLDRNGCVQVVTVDKDEHERILLEHLNALFTSAPGSSDVQYDYGDEEPGPLQLSIPIGYDPQATPLHSPDQVDTGQDLNYVKIDKKGENVQNNDASIEAELELLKLQQTNDSNNKTTTKGAHVVSHNVLTNYLAYPEKPKRDSPMLNSSEIESLNTTDLGQKEEVYGHVGVDPVIYNTDIKYQQPLQTQSENRDAIKSPMPDIKPNNVLNDTETINSSTILEGNSQLNKKEDVNNKLNPEQDYSDIGEAIKLISRFAEVTTDDNFAKYQQNNLSKEDSILGTRTKLQYRRNKPKPSDSEEWLGIMLVP
ncbi:unnamed protein product, partial [Iphiclides podalirius]